MSKSTVRASFTCCSSMIFTLATLTMKTLRRLKSVLEKRKRQIFSLQLQFSIFPLSTVTHCLLCSNTDKTISSHSIMCLFCNFNVDHLATTSFRQSLRRLSGNRLILNWCKWVTLSWLIMLKDDVLSFILFFFWYVIVLFRVYLFSL